MRSITDLAGDGFPLDGSCSLYDENTTGSLNSGKLGMRSSTGGSMTVTLTAKTVIAALTIAVTSDGTGTIAANGTDYAARRIVVISVNGKSVTLTMRSTDPERRIEIASITLRQASSLNSAKRTWSPAPSRSAPISRSRVPPGRYRISRSRPTGRTISRKRSVTSETMSRSGIMPGMRATTQTSVPSTFLRRPQWRTMSSPSRVKT